MTWLLNLFTVVIEAWGIVVLCTLTFVPPVVLGVWLLENRDRVFRAAIFRARRRK